MNSRFQEGFVKTAGAKGKTLKVLGALAKTVGIGGAVGAGGLAALEGNRTLDEQRWLKSVKGNPLTKIIGADKMPDSKLLDLYRSSGGK